MSDPDTVSKTSCKDVSEKLAIPCTRYDYDRLAKIYSDARIDYIVPMPMNGKRMREYVENYDIDLGASIVAADLQEKPAGIGMLGVRGEHGWITRLGVMPRSRRCYFGQYLVQHLLDNARAAGITRMQIEVIVGNDAAYRLFQNFGFKFTRELLVIRRPPHKLAENSDFETAQVEAIPSEEIPEYLTRREPGASWVEESASLLNGGNLEGMKLSLSTCGQEGWVVFQHSPFQLRHFVLSNNICEEVGAALLYQVHKKYSSQDTNIENIPAGHRTWRIYQELGYVEAFRRNEMALDL